MSTEEEDDDQNATSGTAVPVGAVGKGRSLELEENAEDDDEEEEEGKKRLTRRRTAA